MVLRVPVPAPKIQAPPVSIITSSPLPADTTGGRWVDGIAFQPEASGSVWVSDICDGTSSDATQIAAPSGVLEWQPYLLRADDQCSTFGYEAHDFQNRAKRRLDVGSAKALEHEFWAGTLAQAQGYPNRFLAASASASGAWNFVNLNTSPNYPEAGATPSIRRAFEILEQFIADCGLGARGMIHCRPEALPYLTTIRREGNYILTARDTIVVPGTGYPNVGPGGAAPAPGNTWMYATGVTEVRLGPIVTFPSPDEDGDDWLIKAMNRDTNLVTVRAERPGLVSWDGACHAGIQAVLDS